MERRVAGRPLGYHLAMPEYVVEVEGREGDGDGGKGVEMLEVRAPSAMAARGMVERDGYTFVRLRMVGSSKRRDWIESWSGIGAGVVIAVGLLVMAALLLVFL